MIIFYPPTHSHALPNQFNLQQLEITCLNSKMGAWEDCLKNTICAYWPLKYFSCVKISLLSSHLPKRIKSVGIKGACLSGLLGKAWECMGGLK